jgi:hypothetical protein
MKTLRVGLLLAALLAPLGAAGCNPFAMGILTPIPVQPWVSERMEEKYLTSRYDFRTPVMPPIRPGFPPPLCEDPPSEAQIIRTMPRVARGVPYVYEEFRDDYQFVVERLVDKIDPPRFFPLVGPAQLHHCHYKCTVYFTETVETNYPFPVRVRKRRVEVVYIDKDHLHVCTGNDPAVQSQITNDISNAYSGR